MGTKESRERTGRKRQYDKERRKDPALVRAQRILRDYGLTPEQFIEMEAKQEGRCAICKRKPTGSTPQVSRLHVDHCHLTGRVRGLLCHRCNLAIGQLYEDPELFRNALEYLG